MNRDELLSHLYADYVDYCNAHHVPHDSYETWYRQMQVYDTQVLSDALQRPPLPRPRMIHPPLESISGAKMDFSALQPDDEQRAVAEAMRIMGATK